MVKDKETGECFRADHFIKQMSQKMLDDKATPENVRKDLDSVLAKVFVLYGHNWPHYKCQGDVV